MNLKKRPDVKSNSRINSCKENPRKNPNKYSINILSRIEQFNWMK